MTERITGDELWKRLKDFIEEIYGAPDSWPEEIRASVTQFGDILTQAAMRARAEIAAAEAKVQLDIARIEAEMRHQIAKIGAAEIEHHIIFVDPQ